MPAFYTLKDVDAVLDFSIDWTSVFPTHDKIVASSWTADDGLTVDDNTFTDKTTTVWLSGGTKSGAYNVVNHVTTLYGREDDRTIRVTVYEA